MTTHLDTAPTADARPPANRPGSGALHRFAQARPVTAFTIAALGLGWPLLTVITVTRFATVPLSMVFTYGVLLGSALAVGRLADGPGAGRRLLSGLLRWRFGLGRWMTIVLAMPALTIAVAAATGTLHTPDDGWAAAAGHYLVAMFVTGALWVNVAEETAWGGFVQARLTQRHGMLRGALLTAPLFAAIHLPLQFAPGWTWGSVGTGVATLFVIAPFFRYLLGDHLVATGGSLLAVGLQHASFNATGDLFPRSGGWQILPALLLLVAAVAVTRRLRRPGRPHLGAAPASVTDTAGPEPVALTDRSAS